MVLGINAFYSESSACLLRDGVLLAAAEEERFRRSKHWAGFPSAAINQDDKANLARTLSYTLLKRPDLGLVLESLRNKLARRRVQ